MCSKGYEWELYGATDHICLVFIGLKRKTWVFGGCLETRCISREQVFIENVIEVSGLKFLANKYRNRRKRYELRAALIYGTNY